MLLNIKGKGTYFWLLGWGGKRQEEKNIKGIFYEHLAPGRGTSHLLKSAVFSYPNLPEKNKGKAWQQTHRKREVANQLSHEYETNYDWSQNTPYSWPRGITSGIHRGANDSKSSWKKCFKYWTCGRHLHVQFLLEWHFLPYLDEILFELPKCDRFWIAKTNKKLSYSTRVFSGQGTEKKQQTSQTQKGNLANGVDTIGQNFSMNTFGLKHFISEILQCFILHITKQLILKYSSLQQQYKLKNVLKMNGKKCLTLGLTRVLVSSDFSVHS